MFNAISKLFRRGELLKADDLNDLEQRLARLEGVFSGNLSVSNGSGGINVNLPNNIPDFEFVETIDEVTADPTQLFRGYILDQDDNEDFTPVLDFEYLEFRNIFGCTLPAQKRALVIKFPRGNGEWLWIPKACN